MSDLFCHVCKQLGERTDLFPVGKDGRICRACKATAAEKVNAESFLPTETTYEDASCDECAGVTSRRVDGPSAVICERCATQRRSKADRERREKDATDRINVDIGRRYKDSTLENLAVAPDFRERIALAYAAGQSMIFLGANGTGKTHAAVGLFRIAFIDGKRPVFRLTPDIFDDLRRSFDGGDPRKVIAACREAKLLILDDLGAEKPSAWVVEQLCRIIDWRYRDDAQTIITTNLGLSEIAVTYGPRIHSRIIGLVGKNLFRLTGRDRRQDATKGQP